MKIVNKDKFKDVATNQRKKIWMKALQTGGVLLLFLVVFGVLRAQTSPSKYTTDDSMEISYTVAESSGGTYFGALQKAMYIGEGTFQHIDGGVYNGEFVGSKRNGKGTFRWSNGDTFQGTWANDKMAEGTYTFADGVTFTGTFKDDKWEKGHLTLGAALGKYGFTEFSADISNGGVDAVVFTLKDGTHYNGAVSGWAEITYSSGNKYAGDVAGGKRHGEGTFTWTSGARYKGKWNSDVMEGAGEYRYGADTYPYISGTFKSGRPDGKVTYYKDSSKSFKTSWQGGVCVNNNVN